MRIVKIILIVCLSLLASSVFAQLECLGRFSEQPSLISQNAGNIEANMVNTTFINGDAFETTANLIIDSENRRFVQHFEDEFGGIQMVYKNNQAYMKRGNEELELLSSWSAKELEALFEQVVSQNFLPQTYQILSCDGQQEYAELISGEQATATATLKKEPEEFKLIVSENGVLRASIREVPNTGTLLTLVSSTASSKPEQLEPFSLTIKVYLLDSLEPQLTSETILSYTAFNVPIEDSIFNP